jgi:hypothetical protein
METGLVLEILSFFSKEYATVEKNKVPHRSYPWTPHWTVGSTDASGQTPPSVICPFWYR